MKFQKNPDSTFSSWLAFLYKNFPQHQLCWLPSAGYLLLFRNFRFAAIKSICRFVRGILMRMKQHTMTTKCKDSDEREKGPVELTHDKKDPSN